MRLHPRYQQVAKAGNEIGAAIIEIVQKYEITEAELVRILLSETLSWHKYILREERHPGDPEKKADEE